jgi:hypothetical protein
LKALLCCLSGQRLSAIAAREIADTTVAEI